MNILSFSQYPDFLPDREFKESWVTKLISMIVGLVLLIGALVGYTLTSQQPIHIICIVLAVFFFLIAAVSAKSLSRSRGPANWLLRASSRTIWIKFRTYRNAHLPLDDPQIIELDQKEIAWARSVILSKTGPGEVSTGDAGSAPEHSRIRYLELGLTHVDPGKLSDALKREAQVKTEIFVVKNMDRPVIITAHGTLRLRWSGRFRRITPDLKTVLEFISQFAEVRPEASETANYSIAELSKLSEHELRIRVAELLRLEAGPPVIMAIQRVRKCSTTEAMAYIDAL